MVIGEEGEGEGEAKMAKGTITLNQMMVATLCHQEGLEEEDIAGVLMGGRGEDMALEGMVLSDTGGIGDADTTAEEN